MAAFTNESFQLIHLADRPFINYIQAIAYVTIEVKVSIFGKAAIFSGFTITISAFCVCGHFHRMQSRDEITQSKSYECSMLFDYFFGQPEMTPFTVNG